MVSGSVPVDSCHLCGGESAVSIAGRTYCGQCGLERLIDRLRAEAAPVPWKEPSSLDEAGTSAESIRPYDYNPSRPYRHIGPWLKIGPARGA
jgi:hypothetical protein